MQGLHNSKWLAHTEQNEINLTKTILLFGSSCVDTEQNWSCVANNARLKRR